MKSLDLAQIVTQHSPSQTSYDNTYWRRNEGPTHVANYSQPTNILDPELVEGQRKKDGLLAHIERTKDVRNKYNQVFEKSLERVESLKSSLKSHSRKSFELTRNGSQSSFNMNNFDKIAEQSNSPHLAIL